MLHFQDAVQYITWDTQRFITNEALLDESAQLYSHVSILSMFKEGSANLCSVGELNALST